MPAFNAKAGNDYHGVVYWLFLGEFVTYLRHVRSLDFTDKPDYSYLRNLFYDVMRRNSWECDWEFDWVLQHKVRALKLNIKILKQM